MENEQEDDTTVVGPNRGEAPDRIEQKEAPKGGFTVKYLIEYLEYLRMLGGENCEVTFQETFGNGPCREALTMEFYSKGLMGNDKPWIFLTVQQFQP